MSSGQIIKLSDADYFSRSELSKHALDDFMANPFAFFERRKAGIESDKDSEALRFGRFIHAALLEPERIATEYVVQPAEITRRAGKAWEAFKADNEGREIIRESDVLLANGIARRLESHDSVRKVMTACPNREFAVIWNEEVSGTTVPMRAKIDFGSSNLAIIGDLKTTMNASPDAFMRDSEAFGYDIQAAVYIAAARAAGKNPTCFAFIVVEKEYPFTPAIYTFDADSDFIKAGDYAYRNRLKTYVEYLKDDKHPVGWTEHNLNLPPWSKRLKAYNEAREAEAAKQISEITSL